MCNACTNQFFIRAAFQSVCTSSAERALCLMEKTSALGLLLSLELTLTKQEQSYTLKLKSTSGIVCY